MLYLPIETKARELLGKTFLAARAVERGWIVVMGAHLDTRKFMLNRPAGVYVETSIPDAKAARLEQIHAAGHRIVNLCEESIVYADGRDYCTRKLGPNSLHWTDILLVPGERNAEHIHAHRPECDDKVAITGNPRFDILLPRVRCVYNHEADAIKEKFGRFVLVNTNFGRPNPFRPEDDPVAKLIARYREAGAMGPALRRTAPTIVTAASIVAVAMLALSLASYNATRWMGPVLVVGMLVIAVACLTLLPALFAFVRERICFHLYDDREVWQLLGYPGPSYALGGYLHRGFDELPWLPDPRVEELDEPLVELGPLGTSPASEAAASLAAASAGVEVTA